MPEPTITTTKPIKRNLLKALAVLALICAALPLWRRTHSPASGFNELRELSRADFKEIQKAARRAMWQKAFSSGAGWLISPHVVWQLGTSRIRKIEVFTANDVQVQIRSASGDMFYHVVKKETISGQSDWRVVSGQVVIVRLGGWGGGNEVLVEGGMGLFGGSLYAGPDEEYINAFLQHSAAGSGTSTRSPAGLRESIHGFVFES